LKSFKPEMSSKMVEEYLQKIESDKVSNITPIEMGELSKVFSYSKGNSDFVIHFKSSKESMEKVKFISDHFSSVLPLPRILEIGMCGDLHYSISEKVTGTPIITLAEEEVIRLIPALIEQFSLINQARIDGSKGYGSISPLGEASFHTWIEYLASVFEEEQIGFHHEWTKLYENSFLERDVFEKIYTIMIDLAKYAPEERYLVHGDFHFGNMLSKGLVVTGIVDWEMAMYGDFMFDAAVFHLWMPHVQFPQRLRAAWEEKGRSIPHFEQRLLCYQLFKGVDGLRFYAKKADKPSYDFIKARMFSLLKEFEDKKVLN
jgi:hygromycin-B 4-O-kinase